MVDWYAEFKREFTSSDTYMWFLHKITLSKSTTDF